MNKLVLACMVVTCNTQTFSSNRCTAIIIILISQSDLGISGLRVKEYSIMDDSKHTLGASQIPRPRHANVLPVIFQKQSVRKSIQQNSLK